MDVIQDIKDRWTQVMDVEAAGKTLQVFGFSDDESSEDLWQNQLENLVAEYMTATGICQEDAAKHLLEFYSFGDACDRNFQASRLPDHSAAERDGIQVLHPQNR